VSDSAVDILIVDDEEMICFVLTNLFKVHGFSCRSASRGDVALAMIAERTPSLVVLDIRMPGLSGFDVLHRVKQSDPHIPVILMTALSGVRDAVEAMRAGAFDYIAKPFNNNDMIAVVRRALESSKTAAVEEEEDEASFELHPAFASMGQGAAVRALARRCMKFAGTTHPILIVGEIGTGKRMLARILHELSGRAGSFIAQECTGADFRVLRRELFGSADGDGTENTRGRMDFASGGTLLIEGIHEAPMLFQETLADVIRSGVYSPDGGEHLHNNTARLVLTATISGNVLIDDIGISPYLLDILTDYVLTLPALRERREDIPDLAAMFIKDAAEELAKTARGITPNALELLQQYDWPGNVHQLKAVIRRAVLTAHRTIDVDNLELPSTARGKTVPVSERVLADSPLKEQVRRHIAEIERQVLLDTLRKTGWNKAKAARMLQVTYKTMLKKIQDYRLDNPS